MSRKSVHGVRRKKAIVDRDVQFTRVLYFPVSTIIRGATVRARIHRARDEIRTAIDQMTNWPDIDLFSEFQ